MLSQKQLRLVHVAKRQLGLDEPDYRAILLAKGGVSSSKELTLRGLEDVMAHFEHMGFRAKAAGPRAAAESEPADYWRRRQFNRGVFADARQVYRIRQLVALQHYPLAAVCQRQSNGRVEHPEQLTAKEASNAIEMLNAVIARDDQASKTQIVTNEKLKVTESPKCLAHQ